MSYNAGLPVKFYGVSHVTATLTSRHPQLGEETYDADGNKYVWIYNDCNSDLPPGIGLVLQSGVSTAYSMTLTAATNAGICMGVTRHASIPTANYGFVLTRGVGVAEMITASGTVAANQAIAMAADGEWDKVSNTTANLVPAVGQALEAIISGASGSAYFNIY
jgi:hypothetical protein